MEDKAMKKTYEKPVMQVVKIQHTGMLMSSGTFTTTSTNIDDDEDGVGDIIFGGGGIGGAR
jgi:hypothetical protein